MGHKNIDQFPNAEVIVFNKNDEAVFKSRGYKDAWNGKYKGSLLPPGEYKYQIKLNGESGDVLEGPVFMFR